MDFGGIRPHAFNGEHCTIEGDLGLSDLALTAVEGNVMLGCCLHKLQKVPVMFLRDAAINAYVIMHGNYAGEMVCYLVHAHLKDVQGHLQAERHVQEPVPAAVSVKHGQVGGLFI